MRMRTGVKQLAIMKWWVSPLYLVAIFILGTLFLGSAAPAGDEGLLLKLPVRVLEKDPSGNHPVANLSQTDFRLLINEKPYPIEQIVTEEHRLLEHTPGRYMVLGLQGRVFNRNLAAGIDGFVRRLLGAGDRLVVWTPLKIYKMDFDENSSADKIINDIESIGRQDFQAFNTAQAEILRQLSDWLTQTAKKLKKGEQASLPPLLFFIKHYEYQWNQYRQRFLLTNLGQYPVIASLMAQGEGEKWLIHFQQQEVIPYYQRYRELSGKIKEYLASLPKGSEETAKTITAGLKRIEQSMDFSQEVTVDDILDDFLGVGIDYHILFYHAETEPTPEPSVVYSVSTGFNRILCNIAHRCGGECYSPVSLAAGVDMLSRQSHLFYQLIFKYDGLQEDKKIQVQVPSLSDAAEIYHKRLFKKEEFRWMAQWVKEQELGIADYKLDGQKLAFKVTGFQVDATGRVGSGAALLEVRVSLLNDRNEKIYETANTLRGSSDKIAVDIDLPDTYKGYFKLAIEVSDLVSGKQCQSTQYIKLTP